MADGGIFLLDVVVKPCAHITDVVNGSWAKLCAGTKDGEAKAPGPKEAALAKSKEALSKVGAAAKGGSAGGGGGGGGGSGKVLHGFKVGSLVYFEMVITSSDA